ncbi:Protein-lysine N-methyltransferase efm6 [Elasticomyces elasticus]|nr:Protein-lysine N-methyltransferase efm6 [Elasticomyces elasticus]KAK3665544.1 Protein-lysine N-methyltransferase efm6 [Elasticomyces elasticus]KAK4930418.1 Protein-lysine N-methyltransferase efm6 [Elasticomyces elasticus]KAK5768856.1 Protein-lysine N-methyltransferase efm6 [Elasticomyces elasticus]
MIPDHSPEDESDDAELSLTISEDFVQSPMHKQSSTTRIDFDGLLTEQPLLLLENLSKGNGGMSWPAGHVLAKYLLRSKQSMLKESSIVELGSGGGLVGLAIAVACRPEKLVRITDQASMLLLMQQNIDLNGLEGKVEASIYDWGAGNRPTDVPVPDVLLAADCVYFEPAFPLLLQTLEEMIGPKTVCYFCFKRRRRADMHFLKAAKKAFVVEDVDDDPDRATYARENIHL